MIDKSVSAEMKAIAIIMVIAGHFLSNYYRVSPSLAITLGTGGVTIFLMLSGYGLINSYYKNGLHADYWTKKFKKIYVPYLIVTVIWIAVAKLYTLGATVVFKNLIMLDFNRAIDGTMWYLSYLLIWYVLFFAIFVFEYSTAAKLALLFCFSFLFYKANEMSVFSDCSYQFCRNAFSFPLGVLIGAVSELVRKRKTARDGSLHNVLPIALTVIAIAEIAVFLRLNSDSKELVQINGVSEFWLVLMLCSKTTGSRIERALLAVSQISYFLYLIEGKCFSAVSRFGIDNAYWNSLIYLLIISTLGVCYFFFKKNKTAVYSNSKT